MELSYTELLSLAQAFDASSDTIVDNYEELINGFPAWELKNIIGNSYRIKDEFLEIVGYSGVYPSYCNDKKIHVKVHPSPYQRSVCFRNKDTLQWELIEIHKTAIYRINETKFFEKIIKLLEIDTPTNYQDALLKGTLWKLGKANAFNDTHIYLIRNIDLHLPHIMTVLNDSPKPQIVLSASKSLPNILRWPFHCTPILLADALKNENVNSLSPPLEVHDPAPKYNSTPNISYDENKHILIIPGKPPWIIRGKRQQDIVKYMVAQHSATNLPLPLKNIMSATTRPGYEGGAMKMHAIFKGTRWKDYIYSPSRGLYDFKLIQEKPEDTIHSYLTYSTLV